MPFISKELGKASKKAEEEERRKEAKDRQKKEEQQRKQAEEAQQKRKAEEEEKKKLDLEKKEKNNKKKVERKEKKESEKREKELEERKVKRIEEMTKLSKVMGTKYITDEAVFERQGFQIVRNEFASGQYSKIYKAKKGDIEGVVKMISSDKCPKRYLENLQKEGLKILRFLGGDGSQPKAPQFVKIWQIFSLQNKIYIFMDQCLELSIFTRIKAKDTITEFDVKLWAKQLAEAINVLQLSGIAHRNIRTENVIFDKDYKIKLIGFGMCCIFWDNDKQEVIPQSKENPSKKDIKLFDHLPPEVLKTDQYDPSSVDVWSLGVFICILLNKETPFDMKSEQSFEEQWNQYETKFEFNPQLKQLLVNIFVTDSSARIKIEEVLRDQWINHQKLKAV